MLGEELTVLIVIGVAFLGALILSFFLGKRRNKRGLSIIGLLWAGFTATMFFGMYNATGWDGLGLLFALIGVSAPLGVGGLIGSLIGWARSGAKQHEHLPPREGYTDAGSAAR